MRILFAEDEPDLREITIKRLRAAGFGADGCPDGEEALYYLEHTEYDVAILDIMMPNMDGLTVLRTLRSRGSQIPVLLLTARDSVGDRVGGLDAGADDYLTKPFKLGVLLSRVNALLRRANASSAGEPVLESGSITVRLLQGQAYKNGILLELTGAEYKLLCFFMQHLNAVLSKEQILDALWDCDGDYIDSSALTVYIRRLRMKIEDDPGKPQMLLTVRGMGYKWNG